MNQRRSQPPAGSRYPARRDLLRAGALCALGSAVPARGAARRPARSCIFLMLVGGPSHIDTWDPKPGAPREVRSPFRPIRTSVAGIEISELFPRMARLAHHYSLLRAVHHEASPVHDTGHQLIQTGRLSDACIEHPHAGCVVARLLGSRAGLPAHVLLPHPIGDTGAGMPHGQTAGFLGSACEPALLCAGRDESWTRNGCAWPAVPRHLLDLSREPAWMRERYGDTPFGRSCLRARRLVEAGVRFITVNMFESVFDQPTWDAHGFDPFPSLLAYRDSVGPTFDMAYSALLEDLAARGLLDETMVVAAGEFGRSPYPNLAGGRDHWPRCFTVLMGGGPLQRGVVVGASDATGSEPRDRPVSPAEIVATIYAGFGIDGRQRLPVPGAAAIPLVDADVQPVGELLA